MRIQPSYRVDRDATPEGEVVRVFADLPDEEDIGSATVKPHGPGTVEIEWVIVYPRFQKQGIGFALIKHAVQAFPQGTKFRFHAATCPGAELMKKAEQRLPSYVFTEI